MKGLLLSCDTYFCIQKCNLKVRSVVSLDSQKGSTSKLAKTCSSRSIILEKHFLKFAHDRITFQGE